MQIELLHGSINIYRRFTSKAYRNVIYTKASCDIYYDNEMECTTIDRYIVNGKTAQIVSDHFIEILAVLYNDKPFRSIVFNNHYHEISEKELIKKVILRAGEIKQK